MKPRTQLKAGGYDIKKRNEILKVRTSLTAGRGIIIIGG